MRRSASVFIGRCELDAALVAASRGMRSIVERESYGAHRQFQLRIGDAVRRHEGDCIANRAREEAVTARGDANFGPGAAGDIDPRDEATLADVADARMFSKIREERREVVDFRGEAIEHLFLAE